MAHKTAELVSAFEASGLSQEEFCADRGIAVSALQYHLGKVRRRKVVARGDAARTDSGRFVPLRVGEGNSRDRTVVLIHGDIGTAEITHLLRAVAG